MSSSSFPRQFRVIVVASLFVLMVRTTNAQWGFDGPQGQPSVNSFTVPIPPSGPFPSPADYFGGSDCIVTVNGIYRTVHPRNGQAYASSLWTPGSGIEVQGVWAKMTFFGPQLYYVLTSDKHMHIMGFTATYDSKTGERDCSLTSNKDLGTGSPNWQGDIAYPAGDDTYVVTTMGEVWATHNDTTWRVDTSGLNGNRVAVIEVDTQQNVYAATSAGIFKQALTGAQWQLLPGSPKSITYFFRSSKNKLFAASYGSLWMSSNAGVTWNLDTAGMGYTQVKSICDDGGDNYYAVSSSYQYGDHVWKQSGTSPWVAIDAALAGVSAAPSVSYLKAISVDSGIHVATSFGTFSSYDNGTSWQLLTRGTSAANIYAFYKFSNGRELATTDLGLFTKDAGDTAWQKRFPSNSYLSQIKYAVDNSGKIYAFGAARRIGYQTLPFDIYTSTDRGSTWLPDTTGLSLLPSGMEFVDEAGVEHLASSEYPHMRLFSKTPGGQWKGDSAGYQSQSGDSPSIFVSDHHGYIYLAVNNGQNGRMLKQPMGGGPWTEVSTSALGGVPYAITATKDGKLVGGNSNISMGYYNGTSWTLIPPPAGLTNPSGFPESVDSSNRLWVIYGSIDQNYYYTPYGTYWTADLGQHWTKAADASYNFASLVSFGDTTYGLNSGRGLIGMSPANSSVLSAPAAASDWISIVPNPASDRIEFNMDAIQSDVEIFDVKGSKVFTLHGSNKIVWDLLSTGFSHLGNGTYEAKITGLRSNGYSFAVMKQFVLSR